MDEQTFAELRGENLALQLLVGSLSATLARVNPEMERAVLQAFDAAEHLVNVYADQYGTQAPVEFYRTALEVIDKFRPRSEKEAQPKGGI